MTRVLLIDDHPGFGEVMTTVLESLGCAVDVAETPFAGLALSDEVLYDLVLVDQRMPQRTGLEILPSLARRGHRCLLLVTGYPEDVSTARARSAGALGVLPKPMDLDRLISILRYIGEKAPGKVSALPEGLLRIAPARRQAAV